MTALLASGFAVMFFGGMFVGLCVAAILQLQHAGKVLDRMLKRFKN